MNRTRVAGNRDEGEGVVGNTLNLHRQGAVGFIDWLDVDSPTMNQPAYDEATNATEHENRNILVSNDGIRKADEQPEQQSDQPARPRRQLHATDDEADGESTGECAKQSRGLIGERHRQHQSDIEGSEHRARDQTENNFRHKKMF
jgi:hypothetical protein